MLRGVVKLSTRASVGAPQAAAFLWRLIFFYQSLAKKRKYRSQ